MTAVALLTSTGCNSRHRLSTAKRYVLLLLCPFESAACGGPRAAHKQQAGGGGDLCYSVALRAYLPAVPALLKSKYLQLMLCLQAGTGQDAEGSTSVTLIRVEAL